MRIGSLFALLFFSACTRESAPSAMPEPSASPVPVTTSSAPPSASASAAAQFDPIALALPATDAALRAANQKKNGPAHPAPFITADEAHVGGDAKTGFTVTWSRHPPAGWEIEAEATVSPSKQVKVTKADVTFANR